MITSFSTNNVVRAYELDCDVEAKLGQAEEDCILPNNRNTKPERDHNNRKRKEARSRKATERQTAQEDLEDLDAQIESAAAAGKASQALAKELREKRKALQAVTGVKQKKSSNGPRGKDRVINVDDVAESAELQVVCDTIPLDHIDEEKENNAIITSTPQHRGTNNKHGTSLTPHVWINIASTPHRRGTNDKHDASPALPVWNLSSFLDISPALSPLKSPHRPRPELFLPPPDFSSPIRPRLVQNCDLDPSLDPSFLPSLSYYGPFEMSSTDNEYN